jgi:DNA polymerase I-like protein with 3'-5' exonuclease and polymerase domains
MRVKGISDALYTHMKEVSMLCLEMERRGVHVNMDYVVKLEKEFQENKDKL